MSNEELTEQERANLLEVWIRRVAGAVDRSEQALARIETKIGWMPPEETNFRVMHDPPKWTGMSFVHEEVSRCPVGFLRLYVNNLRLFAKKAERTKPSNAARAREMANQAEQWLLWKLREEEHPHYGKRGYGR